MTIASELEDLQTNLEAAKDAVEAKGGTVGDTGLAGLANEIASIPSGGGGDDPGNWGLVYYWPETTLIIENIQAENCTVNIVDEDLFKQAVVSMGRGDAFNLHFMFQQGEGWMNWELSEEPMSTADLLNYGIEVTNFDEETAEYASITIRGNIKVDKTVPVVKLQVQNEAEFLRLRNPDYVGESFETLVPLGLIQKYVIGRAVTELPDGFIGAGENGVLETIDTTYAQNVTTIGNEVFSDNIGDSCYVTCNMSFPSVTSIGNRFMNGTHFAGTMDLPEVKTIGNEFGISWFQLPSMPKVETIGHSFMVNSNLTEVDLGNNCPKLKTIGNLAFSSSRMLQLYLGSKNDLPDLQSIGEGFCYNCLFLNTVVMDAEMVNVLTADANRYRTSFGSSSQNPRFPLYSFGVFLEELGTGTKAAIQAKFPNKSGSDGYYRKWRFAS